MNKYRLRFMTVVGIFVGATKLMVVKFVQTILPSQVKMAAAMLQPAMFKMDKNPF